MAPRTRGRRAPARGGTSRPHPPGSGTAAMHTKRPTINDVARHAGVSKATVSAVLNDVGSVRGSTRDRVRAAIELLNYRPAQRGGRVGVRKGRSLGLLIKEIDNPYYAEVITGARAQANE